MTIIVQAGVLWMKLFEMKVFFVKIFLISDIKESLK